MGEIPGIVVKTRRVGYSFASVRLGYERIGDLERERGCCLPSWRCSLSFCSAILLMLYAEPPSAVIPARPDETVMIVPVGFLGLG